MQDIWNGNINTQPGSNFPDFKIFTLDELYPLKDNKEINPEFPHIYPVNTLLIITSGFGYHEIDFKQYQFTNGSVFFISKEQTQRFRLQPGNSGYVIFFTESFFENNILDGKVLSNSWIYNYHIDTPMIQVNAEMREDFFDILKKIYQEYHNNSGFAQKEVIKTLLFLLLIKSERIKRGLVNRNALAKSDFILKFIDLVEKKIEMSRNAKDYAAWMRVSYKHLSETCKRCLEKTSKEFIDEYIVTVAKRKLVCSASPIKKISESLSFDEPTNFVKYFKKHTAISPAQFRNQYSPPLFR